MYSWIILRPRVFAKDVPDIAQCPPSFVPFGCVLIGAGYNKALFTFFSREVLFGGFVQSRIKFERSEILKFWLGRISFCRFTRGGSGTLPLDWPGPYLHISHSWSWWWGWWWWWSWSWWWWYLSYQVSESHHLRSRGSSSINVYDNNDIEDDYDDAEDDDNDDGDDDNGEDDIKSHITWGQEALPLSRREAHPSICLDLTLSDDLMIWYNRIMMIL